MNFQFATANRIIFERNSHQKLADYVLQSGKRLLLVTGSKPERYSMILQQLTEANIDYHTISITEEPTVKTINEGVSVARDFEADVMLAIGGGSVIDSAKAIAAITSNDGDLLRYLEVVGEGQALEKDPLPLIAIPTTAGTGAEVTKNAVIMVEEKNVKVSLRDNRMIPEIALLDPVLTLTVPPHITASTGLDALTQVIEPYVSRFANPLTDALCRDGIRRAAGAIKTVYHQPDNLAARETMLYVSLLGGLALTNAKLGAVHGFAGTLGGVTGAAHGAICGTLLPHVTEANIKALRAAYHLDGLARYQEIATWLTGNDNATHEHLIQWLHNLVSELESPSLTKLGLSESAIPDVVAQSQKSSSMKGNPIALSTETLTAILQNAL